MHAGRFCRNRHHLLQQRHVLNLIAGVMPFFIGMFLQELAELVLYAIINWSKSCLRCELGIDPVLHFFGKLVSATVVVLI